VIEREHVGFGASGRNGGWCSAILPMGLDTIAATHGEQAAHRMQAAMHATVTEIGRFTEQHAPAGVFHRGGTIDVARTPRQIERLRAHVADQHRFGFGEDDYRWLDVGEVDDHLLIDGALGAAFTPHCATVHPLRLVHALANAVAAAGVTIVEGVAVRDIAPRRLSTDAGDVTADVIVRATEAYTCELPGERRSILPITSSMIATEPLPADVWDRIGLTDRPTFADGRHLVIYGQRTTDDRLAFGGRGAGYRYRSRLTGGPSDGRDDRIRSRLSAELATLFPAVRGCAITHQWSGVLGAARDWQCAVGFDQRSGLAAAGGYVGDGVSTTNLAGRTLAALITGPENEGDADLLALPWVGHRSRRWEPEPLRWLGVNLARLAARRADVAEARRDRGSRLWSGLVSTLMRD